MPILSTILAPLLLCNLNSFRFLSFVFFTFHRFVLSSIFFYSRRRTSIIWDLLKPEIIFLPLLMYYFLHLIHFHLSFDLPLEPSLMPFSHCDNKFDVCDHFGFHNMTVLPFSFYLRENDWKCCYCCNVINHMENIGWPSTMRDHLWHGQSRNSAATRRISEPYIYVLLTSRWNSFSCYDLWESREKYEWPWKIYGVGLIW
jgi:hypothetical protein